MEYDKLPEPPVLRQTAIVEYSCGDHHFRMVVSKAIVRNLPSEDTGRTIKWLHAVGFQIFTDAPETGKEYKTFKFLVPLSYVTSVKPGPAFQIVEHRISPDASVFPPKFPKPDNAMDESAIEKVVASLQVSATE